MGFAIFHGILRSRCLPYSQIAELTYFFWPPPCVRVKRNPLRTHTKNPACVRSWLRLQVIGRSPLRIPNVPRRLCLIAHAFPMQAVDYSSTTNTKPTHEDKLETVDAVTLTSEMDALLPQPFTESAIYDPLAGYVEPGVRR